MTIKIGHTPGPWKCSNAYINNMPNKMVVHVDKWGGLNIADCGTYNSETLANARLISACPDLLEACKMAIGFLHIVNICNINPEQWLAGSDRTYAKTLWENIKSAIAKAEGGTK